MSAKHSTQPSRMTKAPGLEDPVIRQRFEESLRRWQEKGKSVADAARTSERLSRGDLAIRINTLA